MSKTYNDGIIKIYKENKDFSRTNFNEKKNVKNMKDMTYIISLAFQEMSKRTQDLDFASTKGRTLSLKIKTILNDFVKVDYKAIYNKCLYDIYSIDSDRKNKELYIYLEEVQKIDVK